MDQRRDATDVGGASDTSNMRSMAAPTPEQIRALATALDAGVFRSEGLWPDEAQDVENSIVALRAAADELDRLRAELAISENRAGGCEEVVAVLSAVIKNAPHASGCFALVPVNLTYRLDGEPQFSNPCTCWKADAL